MALPEPGPKEGSDSRKSTDQDDKDFDPTPEAMIDDLDDERTLEEEEALGGANNAAAVQDELDDLRKESEMPIEELLAYYERMRSEAQDFNSESREEEDDEDDDDEEGEGDEEDDYGDDEEEEDDDDDEVDDRHWKRNVQVGPEHQAEVPSGLCPYESDLPPYENQDTLVWKCTQDLTQGQILDYLKQASALTKRNEISVSPLSVPKISDDNARLYNERTPEIPVSFVDHKHLGNETLIKVLTDVYMLQSRKRHKIDYEVQRENALAEGNTDVLNWPESKEDNTTSDTIASQDIRAELSTDEYFQDEEQLLFLLLQCNYNTDEAIRRRKLNPLKYYLSDPMSLWSPDECLGFEHGLKLYGKNFRAIRDNKVQTRSYDEVVAFYYLWKKSERHDVYINNYRSDRRRYHTHPGTSDYMDKFIEDNESNSEATSTTTPTPTTDNTSATSSSNTTNMMNLNVKPNSTSASNLNTSSTQPTPPPSTDTVTNSIQYLPPEAISIETTTSTTTTNTSQIPHFHIQVDKSSRKLV